MLAVATGLVGVKDLKTKINTDTGPAVAVEEVITQEDTAAVRTSLLSAYRDVIIS